MTEPDIMKKPFSSKLYEISDKKCRDLIKLELADIYEGCTIVDNPDRYGIDLLVMDGVGNQTGRIEVEQKFNWDGKDFPYSHVHIADRKRKYFTDGDDSNLFVMVNKSFTHYLVIAGSDINDSISITKNTCYTDGEKFIEVDVRRAIIVPVLNKSN